MHCMVKTTSTLPGDPCQRQPSPDTPAASKYNENVDIVPHSSYILKFCVRHISEHAPVLLRDLRHRISGRMLVPESRDV